jgi:predicted TIM-barrel fold metal-dependent hydrolase
MAVTYETTDLALKEIERVGEVEGVSAILMLLHTLEPLGRRRYWPIYEAAERLGLPIMIHINMGGGNPTSATGWGAYHLEYHIAYYQTTQAQLLSLICGGVFEHFPRLKLLFTEGGVAHVPGMLQRLDYHWERLRSEVPDLQRKPSEYMRDHVWFSTQPMDEAPRPNDVVRVFEELGMENIVFATDYPHWDFDSPERSLPKALTDKQRAMILNENARTLFDLGDGS